MPQPIQERLARELFAVVSDPAYQARLRATGFEPLALDRAATLAMYRDEVTRWAVFIKESGLRERSKSGGLFRPAGPRNRRPSTGVGLRILQQD